MDKRREIFLQTTVFPVNPSVSIPSAVNRRDSSVCIYTTPIEILPFNALMNEGVILQYDIPHECLPSFRGLCCSIQYYLTITIIKRDETARFKETKYMNFPFVVYGRGTSKTPHYLQFSSLQCYPLVSIPYETLLSQPPVEDDFYENQRKISTLNNADAAVYAIRDIEFVCTVCVGLSTATYCAGDIITLCLDFEKSVQVCVTVM